MRRTDVLILGAGPAGTSTALALAGHGLKVVIIDRSIFPRPKVCGGFIGPQSKDILSRLGVWQRLIDAGAHLIDKSVLISPSGASVALPMDNQEALGCSRFLFDSVLLNRLKEMGVEVIEGAQARQIISRLNGFEVCIDHYSSNKGLNFYTNHLIDATGHRSPSSNATNIQLGIAALYEQMPSASGQVSLFCCPKGHVGINPFEGDQVNVCYVVQADHFKEKSCNPQRILDDWRQINPALNEMMRHSQRSTPWKAIYVPVRDQVKLFDKGIWYAGDSAAFINPVTGGGMSIALLSGQLLANSIMGYNNDEDRLKAYTENYTKCFLGQRMLAKIWGELAHHKFSSSLVIRFLSSNKYLKSNILQHSHPRLPMDSTVQYLGG